jgi:NADPH2:quinone reductase
MRAIVYERFGGPEVLELREVEPPRPGPRELLIAISAAGVNPVDAQNRADGAWGQIELPVIPGYDFSGVVEEVGEGVEGWAVGDEVFGAPPVRVTRLGSYADYIAVSVDIVSRKPRGLSHVEAAAVPIAACTGYEAIRRLRLEPGERVLILGAGGGVGTFALQFAASSGARVLAVATARHHALLDELGAEACIDYTAENLDEAVGRLAGEVDAIAGFVGGDSLARTLPLLRERGRAVEIAGLDGDLELLIDKNQDFHGLLFNPADPAPLRAVAAAIERGTIRPVVDRVLPLEQAAEAHRLLEAGHRQGKLVLEIRT